MPLTNITPSPATIAVARNKRPKGSPAILAAAVDRSNERLTANAIYAARAAKQPADKPTPELHPLAAAVARSNAGLAADAIYAARAAVSRPQS